MGLFKDIADKYLDDIGDNNMQKEAKNTFKKKVENNQRGLFSEIRGHIPEYWTTQNVMGKTKEDIEQMIEFDKLKAKQTARIANQHILPMCGNYNSITGKPYNAGGFVGSSSAYTTIAGSSDLIGGKNNMTFDRVEPKSINGIDLNISDELILNHRNKDGSIEKVNISVYQFLVGLTRIQRAKQKEKDED